MIVLFYLFALTLAGGYKKTGGEMEKAPAKWRDWRWDESCAAGNADCVMAGTDGVFRFNKNHFEAAPLDQSQWSSNAMFPRGGDVIEMTFDINGLADFWLKSGDLQNKKLTYKFIIPENGNHYSINFQDNDGKLNDVSVKFLKSTSATPQQSLLYMKGGSNWINGVRNDYTNKINYVFSYELADGETLSDFTKYKIPQFEGSSSFSFSLANLPIKENEKLTTNIKMSSNFALPDNSCDTTHCYEYVKSTESGNYQIIVAKTLKGNFVEGFVSEIKTEGENQITEWSYKSNKCQPNSTACVFEDNGVFNFTGSRFTTKLNKIIGTANKIIDVTFDIQQQSSVYLASPGGSQVTYRLNIPVVSVSYDIIFQGNMNDFKNVELNFLKNKGTTNQGNVSIQGLNDNTNKMNYVLKYETSSDETNVNFENYLAAVWKGSNKFILLLENVKLEMNKKTQTNLAIAKDTNNPDFVSTGLFEKGIKYIFETVAETNGNKRISITKQATEKIKGYERTEGNKFVYSENVDPNSVYVKENAGVYSFDKNHFVVGGNWDKNYIYAEGGHKIKVTFDISNSMNLFLSRGNKISTQSKPKYQLIFNPIQIQYGIFFENCDGNIEPVDLIFNPGTENIVHNFYMHGGCTWNGEDCQTNGQYVNPIKYNVIYNLNAYGGDGKFKFSDYMRMCFEDATKYSINVQLPVTQTFESEKTNMFSLETYPLPTDVVQGEGANQVTQKFSFGQKGGHPSVSHLNVILIHTQKKEDENGEKYEGYVRQTGSYTYYFSKTITGNQVDSGAAVLMGESGKYEFGDENMNPESWGQTTIFPGSETKVDIYFDRFDVEGVEDGKQPSVKLYLKTQERIDESKTQISLIISPTRLKNEVIIQQSAKQFTNRLKLKFEPAEYSSDLGGEVYVKGNAKENGDGAFENVRMQLEYKYNGEEDFDFMKYKTIYLQEYFNDQNGKVGLDIQYLFFSGYYVIFDESTETNIAANVKAECYKNSAKVNCNPPTKIETKPYNIDKKNAIVYTLTYDPNDYSANHNPKYYIKSKLIPYSDEYNVNVDFDNSNNNNNNNNNNNGKKTDEASSVFILLIAFIVFMLF